MRDNSILWTGIQMEVPPWQYCQGRIHCLFFQGALYANNNGLDKAIMDFEAALRSNPSHQNAKKYLCETLIAVGRNHEEDKNVMDLIV